MAYLDLQERRRELGEYANPLAYQDPIDISTADPSLLLEQLQMMLRIRYAEEQIGNWVTEGLARCPCHLGIGQEAIATGVAAALRKTDKVFGTHRSHSQYLAMGCDLTMLLAEVLGKVTGCSRGMGGSMHLYGGEQGFVGSVPIVAATISLAVGAALAAKMDGRGAVAVTFFGDGASEEGSLHESLNLAALYRLPVIFVCENNLFASHLHISQRQPGDAISRFADAHCIEAEIIDGNDVVMVNRAAERAVQRARLMQSPFFLEAVTYRWCGHVGPCEDLDVGVKRNENLLIWKQRDPIRRLTDSLRETGILTAGRLARMEALVHDEVMSAAAAAEAAPYPPLTQLLDTVYYAEVTHAR
jgi:pyruvate dehydrogenase E1 component alpha subunit